QCFFTVHSFGFSDEPRPRQRPRVPQNLYAIEFVNQRPGFGARFAREQCRGLASGVRERGFPDTERRSAGDIRNLDATNGSGSAQLKSGPVPQSGKTARRISRSTVENRGELVRHYGAHVWTLVCPLSCINA